MQMLNNVVPAYACCMLQLTPCMNGLVTPLPLVKCTVSILKITVCLPELRWY